MGNLNMINPSFWKGKRVLITGITGFKGTWLAIWLTRMGALPFGYSLPMESYPSAFAVCGGSKIPWAIGDIRDTTHVRSIMLDDKSEIVFHLAAQPIVRHAYRDPLETLDINVMGTASVLEAIRGVPSVKAVVIVTSDKVYENIVYTNGHKENDRLGGGDPYSASKACAELVVEAYRQSFFKDGEVRIATARAGNVIGGGDWAEDRIIPDAVRALARGDTLLVRNPRATRPWQHVLDPLGGYLLLAEHLCESPKWIGAWNFGPYDGFEVPVSELLNLFYKKWGHGKWREEKSDLHMFEYEQLKLDCTLAYAQLGWYQRVSLESMIDLTVDWYKRHAAGENMLDITHKQLDQVCSID